MIVLLVMTDGRGSCITQTIPSALAHLDGPITRKVIHDDSGNSDYQHWLRATFPDFEVVHTAGRSGFGGAIRNAWDHLRSTTELDDCRFVCHLEDDFTFNRRVPLDRMGGVLDRHPQLVQLALRRQPWNAAELAAGGVIETAPDAYTQCSDGTDSWLEHRQFFTTNPSLYRRSLVWRGWPDCDQSEGRFAHSVMEDGTVRFGYWGARNSGEWVHHIGTNREGVGY